MGSIFAVFGASKKEAKSERILGSILEDRRWDRRCLSGLKILLEMMVWNGKEGWVGVQDSARPGPEGGRIEPAEPEPPPALLIRKVRKADVAFV